MNRLQKIMLAALFLGMLAVIILTWGSVGSAILAYCLISGGAALLFQRFLNKEDGESWDME